MIDFNQLPKITQNPFETYGVDTPDGQFKRDMLVLRAMGLPPCYDNAVFGHSYFDDTTQSSRFYSRLMSEGRSSGLLLGATGSGKTHSGIAWLVRVADVSIQSDRVERVSAMMIKAYDMSEALVKKDHKLITQLKKTSALLIDDLGVEPPGWKGDDFVACLENIIDARYESRKKTVITTNYSMEPEPKELNFVERYGARIESRLRHNGLVFETACNDMRIK